MTRPPSRPLGRSDTLTAEDHAALAYVERLIAETPDPDRASAPEDEALIEDLLDDGERSEYRMVRILTNVDRAPSLSSDGPMLRLIEGPED